MAHRDRGGGAAGHEEKKILLIAAASLKMMGFEMSYSVGVGLWGLAHSVAVLRIVGGRQRDSRTS